MSGDATSRLQREPDRLADDARDLDLVRLAVGPLGHVRRKDLRGERVAADAVVELELPVAQHDVLRRPVHRRRRREVLHLGAVVNRGLAKRRCMKVFQIIAGYVPPATGSPWNWFVIGTSLFG